MPDTPVDISYDGYDLQDDTIITSSIDGDDGLPSKVISVYELPILPGGKITNEKFQSRRITLSGKIKSPTASGLISKLEEVKEVFSRQQKTLILTYPDNNRRIYTASVESFPDPKRPSYSVNITDYNVTFVCTEPWAVNSQTTVSGVYAISQSITGLNVGISGMVDPQPVITFNTTASGSQFLIANNTTGDSMVVSTTFSGTGRQLSIDTYKFEVRLDGVPVEYKGRFPRFNKGLNSLTIATLGTAGSAVDQSMDIASLYGIGKQPFGRDYYIAQSFVPTKPYLLYVELRIGYNSSIAGDITVEIRSNNSGFPSSTVLSTASIPAITSRLAWRRAVFPSAVTLTPGTTYWIVVYSANSNRSYTYEIESYHVSRYANGYAAFSSNSGLSWAGGSLYNYFDIFFRTIADSGTPLTGTLAIEYNPRKW